MNCVDVFSSRSLAIKYSKNMNHVAGRYLTAIPLVAALTLFTAGSNTFAQSAAQYADSRLKPPPVAPSGPTPRTSDGHPDLTGHWISFEHPKGNLAKDYFHFKLPFTAEGISAYKNNIEHIVDPESLCVIGGVPRHNTDFVPFEIVQGTDRMVFLYTYTNFRSVPFDGQKHTEDPDPSFFGESIAWWDGDIFVIDSIAFKSERVWADENGAPHSDQLHLVERWSRPDLGHLRVDQTLYDPKFYTEPVHYHQTWIRGKTSDRLREMSCSENNVDAPHLGPGPGPIDKNGERGYGDNMAPLPPPPSKERPAVTSIPE